MKCAICECEQEVKNCTFDGDHVLVCKSCKQKLREYTRFKVCDRKSQLYGKIALKGANMIIKENGKFYLSSSYSDYDLLLTNSEWASKLF